MKGTIPIAVKTAFESLKKEYKFFIVLRNLNHRYYVYRQTARWDKNEKKVKNKQEYLGKIDERGKFVKKSAFKIIDVASAKAVIEAHGGEVNFRVGSKQNESDYGIGTDFNEADNTILKLLSSNARESVAEISKKINLSESATSSRIKKLEERLGIKYTIDLTLDKFHLYRFVAIAKFEERPDFKEVKKLLAEDARIRLVLSARGAYDLFIFMFVKEPLEAEEIVYKLRSHPLLAKYKGQWYVSYHSQSYGFIPFRDEFFDMLIREKLVWKRTKDKETQEWPKRLPGQLFYSEYATLRALNQNSSTAFNIIDEKYKINFGSSRETYHKLLDSGSIRSATITMTKPPVKDTAIVILEQTDIDEFNKHKKDYFKYRLAEENTLLNKFLLSGDLGAPYGILIVIPVYKNGDLDKIEKELAEVARGTKIHISLISDILVGNLGYRKIESKYTHLYKKLQEEELLTTQ